MIDHNKVLIRCFVGNHTDIQVESFDEIVHLLSLVLDFESLSQCFLVVFLGMDKLLLLEVICALIFQGFSVSHDFRVRPQESCSLLVIDLSEFNFENQSCTTWNLWRRSACTVAIV